jgi:hypothetical protein
MHLGAELKSSASSILTREKCTRHHTLIYSIENKCLTDKPRKRLLVMHPARANRKCRQPKKQSRFRRKACEEDQKDCGVVVFYISRTGPNS